MKFYGISQRFSFIDSAQYETIGNYWDYLSQFYGRSQLLGLGLNWNEDSLEYVIGDLKPLKWDLSQIHAVYPHAIYKVVDLPDDGWQTVHGKTKNLDAIYQKIYRDGALTYEIEQFNDKTDEDCVIHYWRK